MKKLLTLLGVVVMGVAMMGCNIGTGACSGSKCCGTDGKCCKAAQTKCCGTDGKCCKSADAGHPHGHIHTAVN